MSTNTAAPQWYVAFTRPKTEKRVAQSISDMGIECFLPLHNVVRQWSDRKKTVEMPLFPNYVFVNVAEKLRCSLFSVKHLVKFISIERRPVVVREKEITLIKKALNPALEVSPAQYFAKGMRVRIASGDFEGMEGVIQKINSRTRLVVKIDILRQAFSFNISSSMAEIISVEGSANQIEMVCK